MTKIVRCRWCGRTIEVGEGRGRPRAFCRRSCRQRDFEARQRAARHGLDETEIIIARRELHELRDRLFMLRCAVEDVERDLAGAPLKQDYADAVAWLLEAARPLVSETL